MRHRQSLTSVALTLLLIFSAVAGVTVLSGTAAAQSGSIDLQDTTAAGASQFTVTVPSLDGPADNTGCVVVGNSNTDEQFEAYSVSEGERLTVSASEVGGLTAGDRLTTTLYADPGGCDGQLDTDRTTVQGTGSFEVSIDSTNSPVAAGETLRVTATIENTGEEGGSQRVSLLIDQEPVETKRVELGGGQSTTETFRWQTTSDDAGGHVATVQSDDDFDSRDVRVTGQSQFQVSVTRTNSPVEAGESLQVTTNVENTGSASDTQTISLAIGDQTVAETLVTLEGGESTTVTLEWDTDQSDAGTYRATVSSNDDGDFVDVRVMGSTSFDVSVGSTNSPVTERKRIQVEATVENVGDASGSKTVRLAVDREVVDSTTVTLDQGESETILLFWDTREGDAGTYRAEVSTDSARETATVRVLEPGSITVGIDSTNAPVAPGDTLDVTATIENTGEARVTQSVDLVIDDEVVDSTDEALESGQTKTVTLSWETADDDSGEYTATVNSEDDTAETTVAVNTTGEFSVSIVGKNDPIPVGETLRITANVENTGSTTATQRISLTLDGREYDSQSVTLDGGESREVSLTWQTESGDERLYTAEVSSEDTADDTVVTVADQSETPSETGSLDLSIDSANTTVTEGDPLEITATVTNPGTESRTEQLTLQTAGTVRDQREVTVAGGESQSVTLVWETAAGDAGEYTAAVASETGEATASVTVGSSETTTAANSTFAVTIDEVSAPDGNDTTFEASATIQNGGNTTDTQTVTLTSGGTDRDSRELTLGPGESETITFSWEQESSGEVEIEVASETDRDVSSASVDDGGGGGPPVSTTTSILLVLLVLIAIAAYYYIRRRQQDEGTYAEGSRGGPPQDGRPGDKPPQQGGRRGSRAKPGGPQNQQQPPQQGGSPNPQGPPPSDQQGGPQGPPPGDQPPQQGGSPNPQGPPPGDQQGGPQGPPPGDQPPQQGGSPNPQGPPPSDQHESGGPEPGRDERQQEADDGDSETPNSGDKNE